jgi:NAD(P)-dependent dehydrogenase (short-subunit alcohol dehydrogenase family)
MVANKIFERFIASLPALNGRVYAITGTTSGTGYYAAEAAVQKRAACVILLNRSSARADAALAKLKALRSSGTAIIAVECDLQSFASVRVAASTVAQLASERGGLDGLICNAGVMALPDTRTEDGHDAQMQTNHLSHFLLCRLLMPSLEAAAATRAEARIVQHSSGARGRRMAKDREGNLEPSYFEASAAGSLGGNDVGACLDRYHQTKLSNAVFAMALHERLAAIGSKVRPS